MLTSIQIVRFLRDYQSFNLLLDETQFTQEDLDQAISMAISEFNAITPMSNYNAENFPNDYLLLLGSACYLLTSEMFLQLRSSASYQDGDVNVRIGDNLRDYQTVKDSLKREWKETAQKLKQQMNLETAYGSLRSGYSHIKGSTGNR